jgi:threonine synthase
MDISKASNFERFVFDLLGRDGARLPRLFDDALTRDGRFDLSADPRFAEAAARYGFVSGTSTHADRLATIRDTCMPAWRDHRHPHRRRREGGARAPGPACR